MKRVFSLFLCLVMLLSLFPTALAAELESEDPAQTDPTTQSEVEIPAEPDASVAVGTDDPSGLTDPADAASPSGGSGSAGADRGEDNAEEPGDESDPTDVGADALGGPASPSGGSGSAGADRGSDDAEEPGNADPTDVGAGVLDGPSETGDDAETPDDAAPADTDTPTDDTDNTPEETPVRVRFVCEPEEAEITVYDPETLDENGNPVVIEPEEDESWLLLPGTYRYDAAAEGYVSLEKVEFTVEAAEEAAPPQEIRVTLDKADGNDPADAPADTDDGADEVEPDDPAETDSDAPTDDTDSTPETEPVRVRFVCDPEDAAVMVFDPSKVDENGQAQMVDAEEDGSYLLVSGVYYYRVVREGYSSIECAELRVENTEEQIINIALEESASSLITYSITNIDASPYPKVELSYTNSAVVGTIRYISQIAGSSNFYDGYWNNWKSSAGIECGTASISMALSYVGVNKTPANILDAGNGTTYFGWTWGAASHSSPGFSSAMDNYLSGGGKYSPPIIHFPAGTLTAAGHYAVVAGKISSSQFYIVDPAYGIGTIVINGNNWSYRGTSGSIDQVHQYYNPNAEVVPQFSIRASYDCDLTVTTSKSLSVWSMPGTNETYPASTKQDTLSSGTKVHAIKIIENNASVAGHYWYQITYGSGKTGYIYSNDTKNPTQNWTVSASNVSKPGDMNLGATFVVKGTVTTGGSTITKLQGHIYPGNTTTGTPNQSSTAVSPNSTSYNLSGIDASMRFDLVKPAGYYTYTVRVTLSSYTMANGKPKQETQDCVVNDVTKYYKVGAAPAQYYLDLNGWIDGSASGDISGAGTADIYINGNLVESGVTDYYRQWVTGTSYEIRNIQPTAGYVYNGLYSGSLSGKIGSSNVAVVLSFSKKTYSISYNANGGSGAPGSQTKTHGTALTLSSTKPSRSGYTFVGWSTSASATTAQYQPGGSFTTNANTTLYAVWAKEFTISYNANGGSGAPGSQIKKSGVGLTLSSAVPTRPCHIFRGWATSANATEAQYQPGASFWLDANTTLYAVWAEGELSEWSTTRPSGVPDSQIETRTQYRYSDYETTTSTSSSLSGWTQYDSSTSWSDYGAWSGWSTTAVSASETTQVETRTAYGWYYFRCPNCGAHMHGYGTCWTWCGGCGAKTTDSGWTQMYDPTNWNVAKDWYGTGKYYATINGETWFRWDDGGTQTQYRYRTRSKVTTYYYYRWGSWSEWSDSVYTASSSRQVLTRTLYRYTLDGSNVHNWDGGRVTRAATCDESGSVLYTCTKCGTTKTEALAILPHDFGTPTYTWFDESGEVMGKVICRNNPGHVIAETVSWTKQVLSNASCTAGEVAVYTATFREPYFTTQTKTVTGQPLGHSWGSWTVTTPATAQQASVEARTCSRCGETETRSIPQLNTYIITYNANGGIGAPGSQTKTHGAALTLSSTRPTRGGYTFLGWATSAGATAAEYQPGASFTTDANTTLYAVWKAVPSSGFTLKLSDGSGLPGEDVTVTLSLKNNPGIKGVSAVLEYDHTKLQLLSAQPGTTLGTWSIDSIAEDSIVYWYSTDSYTENADFLVLSFKILEGAAPGATAVSLSFGDWDGVYGSSGDEISDYAVVDGTVTITDRVRGDVTGDRKVNLSDVIRLAEYVKAKGVGVEIVPGSADVSGDGKVNLSDVIRLAEYVKAKGVGVVIY